MRLAMSLLVLGALTTLARSAEAKTVNYALIVGNNTAPEGSQEELTDLRYADDDAARFYRLFSQLGESRLLTELDDRSQRRFHGLATETARPTLGNLRAQIERFAESMRADIARGDSPVLYFVFSGHGTLDENGHAYLALADGKLTADILYEELVDALPTRYTHLIIDACHAGGVVGARGGFFDREATAPRASVNANQVAQKLAAARATRHPGLGYLLSASLGQRAHEWSEIESGVFSHEVLSGLLGAADINGDGRVAYSELRAFVASANRGIEDVRAQPTILAQAPSADRAAPLVRTSELSQTRALSGDASALGRFYIELPNGARYLEAHLGSHQSRLRVPRGDVYIRTADQEAKLPSAGPAKFSDLTWTRRDAQSRGSLEVSYRTALFGSRYARPYYEGWVDSQGAHSVKFRTPSPERFAGLTSPESTPPKAPKSSLAFGLATVSGTGVLVSLASGYYALDARRDWEATELQRPASLARERYDRARTVAFSSLAVAAFAGAAAWHFWPKASITAEASPSGAGLALRGTF